MKSIGFKNFRRFANLDPLQLGDITFFVGGNNAGKSTVVKAMMLVLDNIATRNMTINSNKIFEAPTFRLDANRIHEVHIGTFGRALHKPYPEQKEIVLEADIDDYHFRYELTGDTGSKQANSEIARLEIVNKQTNVSYLFDFHKNEAIVKYDTIVLKDFASEYLLRSQRAQAEERLNIMLQRRAEILAELKSVDGDAVQIARLNSNFKMVDHSIKAIKQMLDPFDGKLKNEAVEYKDSISLFEVGGYGSLLSALLRGLSRKFDKNVYFDAEGNEFVAPEDEKESEQPLQEKAFARMLSEEARRLFMLRSRNVIEYISAHAATQKVLFSIEDKNDYMASVIREFKQCRITEGSKEDLFITRWMNELEIGIRYQIDPISGEAYTMEITNKQGNTMPLADMGMGSIQMMILLLKLATIINQKRGRDTIIIVEEPEQNIHPKLQSKLAELFAHVNREYGFRFVIETHSEYMIRKSQAMVANGDVAFEKNPFKVFFFPENGEPYDMVYQANGRFKESFDSGFFDEAAKWTSEISAVELKNAPKQKFQWEEK